MDVGAVAHTCVLGRGHWRGRWACFEDWWFQDGAALRAPHSSAGLAFELQIGMELAAEGSSTGALRAVGSGAEAQRRPITRAVPARQVPDSLGAGSLPKGGQACF